ncbi:MAG: cell division protein ZapE [Proteobacteria bacterium]|nr:AFG1 family ATPase [Pseudomonadota bacterium]NOG59894.1 cell division protein ZapE [Pseudomonadota bacterium]
MQTPLDKYTSDLQQEEFTADPAQKIAVMHMQRLFEKLIEPPQKQNGFVNRIKSIFNKTEKQEIKGLYFWGGVGRGKTYLVDSFYDCLPFENKIRIHFHRFMQNIHKELKTLGNIESPLKIIAQRLADETRILCFDEFHVSDITDAMLLGGLFEALFERGVILVTTSNQHPDQLYQGGLQRERFLPAIALLKQYTEVVNVDSGVDYRLQFLDHAEIYHSPLDKRANTMLEDDFVHVCPDEGSKEEILDIEGRTIQTVRCGDGVVWFDFKALCDGPRGAADYIEIARQYQTVLLANIPIMDDHENDMVKRFITLVDEFYDRHVKLIITAESVPEGLYKGTRLAEAFKRTISRLEEMRTHDYLAKEHIP